MTIVEKHGRQYKSVRDTKQCNKLRRNYSGRNQHDTPRWL